MCLMTYGAAVFTHFFHLFYIFKIEAAHRDRLYCLNEAMERI